MTGTEPAAPRLEDEPYWTTLATLIDWAEDNTSSAIWSCLAAHAAILRIDGIERQPLGGKLSGVFDCAMATSHSLTAGLPRRWSVPHSRCNGIRERNLLDNGYTILLGSDEVGPDIFLKERNSLFLFVQGHPEYDARDLLREYRRDVRRFLAGERPDYPEMPCGYFDAAAADAFAAFRDRAGRERSADLVERFPDVRLDEAFAQRWQAPALRLYENWLAFLTERKLRHRGEDFRREQQAFEAAPAARS